jgi:hypothetical protein
VFSVLFSGEISPFSYKEIGFFLNSSLNSNNIASFLLNSFGQIFDIQKIKK